MQKLTARGGMGRNAPKQTKSQAALGGRLDGLPLYAQNFIPESAFRPFTYARPKNNLKKFLTPQVRSGLLRLCGSKPPEETPSGTERHRRSGAQHLSAIIICPGSEPRPFQFKYYFPGRPCASFF